MKSKSTFLFLAAAFALTCLDRNAFGYALEGQLWPDGNIVMNVQLGTNSGTLIDGSASFEASAEDALAQWNQYITRVQFAVTHSNVTPSNGDAINSIYFSSTVFGDAFGADTLAVTSRLIQGSTLVEADVTFNNAQPFNSYRGPLQRTADGATLNDLHRVALHEFGHVLGLDHPDDIGQNVIAQMNSREGDLDALSQDDVNGAFYLYGSTAPTATPTPAPAAGNNLVNLSTRLFVGTGDNALIGGFIIQGAQPKQLLVRAKGPSLAAQGISGALPDPTLSLFNSASTLVATNDDWTASANAQAIANTGLAPTDRLESAILISLDPGNYTAVVKDATGATGVGLFELYDLDPTGGQASNISTRGRVLTGDNVIIGGFIVGGNQTKTVVVRAIGPSLSKQGVPGALSDPDLELHDANGTLLDFNDDWQSSAQAAQITAANLAPTEPTEAAIYTTLNPGNYTAIVRGVNDSTGVGLVEIYDLSPAPNQ